MYIMNNNIRRQVDLESKVTECWNLVTDLNLLNQAALDFEKPREVILQILDGIIQIYDVRFALIKSDFEYLKQSFEENKVEYETQWDEKYDQCLVLLEDLKVLSKYMKEKTMTVDELSNAILGLETLGNVKFELLFDEFSNLIQYSSKVMVNRN